MFSGFVNVWRSWSLWGLAVALFCCGETNVACASCGDYLQLPGMPDRSHASALENGDPLRPELRTSCPCRDSRCRSAPPLPLNPTPFRVELSSNDPLLLDSMEFKAVISGIGSGKLEGSINWPQPTASRLDRPPRSAS